MRALRFSRLWRALLLFAVLALVVLCVLPESPDPLGVRHADKLYHVAGYALLAAGTVQVYAGSALAWRLLALLALGVLLEGVQALLPWRSADPMDALANTVGVLAGAALAFTPAATLLCRLERYLPANPQHPV